MSDSNTSQNVTVKQRPDLTGWAMLIIAFAFAVVAVWFVLNQSDFWPKPAPTPVTVTATAAPSAPAVETPAAPPVPAIDPELQAIWTARAAEHSGDGEFSLEHLAQMDQLIDTGTATLLTPQRLQGYHSGGDYPMVDATLKQHLGQFAAYVLEVDRVMYIVPLTEKLAACGSVCTEPRLVVWHLHKYVAKKKSPPRVSTPKPTRPAPDEIEMICSPNC